MEGCSLPGTPADNSAAPHAVDDAGLAAEEFALLWRLARRLQGCGAVAETGIHHEGRLLEPVTASIGVAEWSGTAADAVAVIDFADQAMDRAKRSGGNRICVADHGSA